MKLFSPRHYLWLALISASAPALLFGCGGGNSTPSVPAIPVSIPAVTLDNGQRATLKFSIRGTAINGTIAIANGANAPGTQIPPGVYPFSGTFTPPRGYAVAGTLGTLGGFTARGDLPTTSQTGTYRFNFAGQSASGILPVLTNPID